MKNLFKFIWIVAIFFIMNIILLILSCLYFGRQAITYSDILVGPLSLILGAGFWELLK